MPRFLGKALVLAATVVALSTVAGAQIPDEFTNLQVFPKDIKKEDLVNAMKGFSMGLGVRCWFCHEGEGDDLSKYDFPSDEKEHKNIAREMLRMTMMINQKFISKVAHHEEVIRVQCVTCHRGKEKPTLDME